MHRKHVLGFERDCFDRPGVRTDGDDALADQIFRALDADAGFARVVALVVLADQAGPGGMEENDVALADFDALFFRDFVDFLDVEGGAFLDDIGVVIGAMSSITPRVTIGGIYSTPSFFSPSAAAKSADLSPL